jgi:hypothetical protein
LKFSFAKFFCNISLLDLVKSNSHDIAGLLFWVQGNVWVAPLVCGDWSKTTLKQVGNDMMPSLRHANLGDRVLHLKARDDTEETISLNGCRVFAVSGGVGPKQKW